MSNAQSHIYYTLKNQIKNQIIIFLFELELPNMSSKYQYRRAIYLQIYWCARSA